MSEQITQKQKSILDSVFGWSNNLKARNTVYQTHTEMLFLCLLSLKAHFVNYVVWVGLFMLFLSLFMRRLPALCHLSLCYV